MGRLRMVRLYRTDDVPDHILKEVCALVDKLGVVLGKAIEGHDPNIILSAFNRFHAGMIVALVEPQSLEDAAKSEAIGILKNVDHMAQTNYFGENE